MYAYFIKIYSKAKNNLVNVLSSLKLKNKIICRDVLFFPLLSLLEDFIFDFRGKETFTIRNK